MRGGGKRGQALKKKLQRKDVRSTQVRGCLSGRRAMVIDVGLS